MIEAIADSGYGLTLGIHSRIDETVDDIVARLQVGNVYVNRNMIGAVVGVQPFGGHGLSGTGPKAGGPHYLPRFATEQTITVNTAAAGGNAALMAQEDDGVAARSKRTLTVIAEEARSAEAARRDGGSAVASGCRELAVRNDDYFDAALSPTPQNLRW